MLRVVGTVHSQVALHVLCGFLLLLLLLLDLCPSRTLSGCNLRLLLAIACYLDGTGEAADTQ